MLLVPRHAAAQTDFQVWSNVTFNWVKSPRVAYGLDFEPKVLVTVPPGDSRWSSVDAIPSVDYVAKHWLDLTGEFDAGYTKQTNDENSLELAPRVGARIHLLSRERPPTRRLVLRDWVRVEWRNFFYNTAKPDSSTWRFRNRLEALFPLNRQKITDDGARYLLADWEWF